MHVSTSPRITPHVRSVPLSIDNAPDFVRIGAEMHLVSDYKHIPYDYDYCLLSAQHATTDPNQFARLSIDSHDRYTGIISGHVEPFIFSTRLFAMETTWYVRPGTPMRASAACALMDRFLEWAFDDWHCVHVLSSDTANISSRGVDAIHRHVGFRRNGSVFIYDPNDTR